MYALRLRCACVSLGRSQWQNNISEALEGLISASLSVLERHGGLSV